MTDPTINQPGVTRDTINGLADRMPGVASALPDGDRDLLRTIFQAGAEQVLAGGRPARLGTVVGEGDGESGGSWRIGRVGPTPGGGASKHGGQSAD